MHPPEDTVYLSPGCTGRGIGSALLGTLLAGCATAGARQVIAVIAGVGRKHGRWIDTLLMQKELMQKELE